jgi:hypothetical protein
MGFGCLLRLYVPCGIKQKADSRKQKAGVSQQLSTISMTCGQLKGL